MNESLQNVGTVYGVVQAVGYEVQIVWLSLGRVM